MFSCLNKHVNRRIRRLKLNRELQETPSHPCENKGGFNWTSWKRAGKMGKAQRLNTGVTIMHIVHRWLVYAIISGVGGGFLSTRAQGQWKPVKVIDRTVTTAFRKWRNSGACNLESGRKFEFYCCYPQWKKRVSYWKRRGEEVVLLPGLLVPTWLSNGLEELLWSKNGTFFI